ncbi:MAG: SBBP repeat-containing protein [Candidatus Cloacimonadaceae bacterium]
MKKYTVLFLMLMLLGIVAAQTPDWLWAQSAGGTNHDHGYAIAVDSGGNTYVTGWFDGTVTFGNTTLNCIGNRDIFVAKLDSAGNWLWAKGAGGTDEDIGEAIAVDSEGNVYVTGRFWQTAFFGGITLSNSGWTDLFVAKLDSNGNWLWAKSAGGTGPESGEGIAVDDLSNVYLTGSFQGIATFGTIQLSSAGESDIFAAKLDTNGNWLWAKRAGGECGAYGEDIAVDSAGNAYITGYFGDWGGGDISIGSTTLTSSGWYDAFVAKLDSVGNWLWAKKGGAEGRDSASGIAVDSSSNVYFTGTFFGSSDFGSFHLTGNGPDVFLVKLDSTGNWLWAKSAWGQGQDISVDSADNVYLAGYFGSMPGDTSDFGTTTLTCSGESDVFTAKLDSNGNWLWAQRGGGINSEECESIAVDNSGSVYLTGSFGDWSGIASTFGTHALTSNGISDIFVAKLVSAESNPIPKIPQNLLIQRNGLNVIISWNPVTEDTNNQPFTPDAYKIEISENNSDWSDLVTLTATQYSYTDTSLNHDSKFYRVIAVKN